MPEIACVNGKFMPLDRAAVHVEDRGYQFADAVYEVLRTYGGRPFAADEHLARLFRSLKAINLKHRFTRPQLAALIREALRRAAWPEAVVYLQISRGSAPRHRGVPARCDPTLVLTVRPLVMTPATAAALRNGLRLVTVTDERWGRCDIKSVGLLANVLAYDAAHRAGADDAIFVGEDDVVAEATAGNIFLVSNGRLRTPPLSPRILAGVTRAKVLVLAGRLGIAQAEKRCTRSELLAADEVFLSSTTNGVVPVTRVDGRRIGTGIPGPVTKRLTDELERRARQV